MDMDMDMDMDMHVHSQLCIPPQLGPTTLLGRRALHRSTAVYLLPYDMRVDGVNTVCT